MCLYEIIHKDAIPKMAGIGFEDCHLNYLEMKGQKWARNNHFHDI